MKNWHVNKLYQSSQLINQGFAGLGKSMMWLGSAQFSGRMIRLVSSVILARLLMPEIFGQAAIVLTLFELICTATRRITSAALIRMDDQTFSDHFNSANWVNVIVCIIAFLLMVAISFPLANYYQSPQLVMPIALMATSFLFLPMGMQYATLNLRRNNMRIVGRANLWQTLIDAFLTATLALLGFGIWAIILPKVLVIFIWIAIHRYQNPLPQTLSTSNTFRDINLVKITSLLAFGIPVSLSDLTTTLRQNIDYLLIGFFMGVETLGVYFFAYNISLGISLGLIQSFGTAFYSHLCQRSSLQRDLCAKYLSSIAAIMAITIPIILLQSLLSHWYVPMVYGDKWLATDAVSVFLFLCLSGLARPLGEAASQLLLVNGLSQVNLKINLLLTALYAVVISIACQYSLVAVAQTVMVTYLITLPLVSIYSYQRVFKSTLQLSPVGESS
ncbi:polysaccharide biosynthesis protein [Shewanella sp. Actino-trap-3]|jgi:teichuronic acid exporter|uniref:oligosaccharide flippase family protein n=1 Tax=Shewanella sp. Actino-trap-3 TaxID=2058331 RepID=UPI000C348849|nr:oligosaccharide flippase family protein [Shewanella sp. Actino-trap-3]PKG77006.1 polysaccharide biosynthesis protein [Shewanella sp. Actino-trap-3]